MKKFTAMKLALLLILSLAGCGENKTATDPTMPSGTAATKEEATAVPSSERVETSSSEETTTPAPTESPATHTETETASDGMTQCNAILLKGFMNDEKTGVIYEILPDLENRGPTEFAVISESDILILDMQASRLQRYKDGQYFETIGLPQKYYLRLCVIGETAYVLTSDSLLKIDLNTKEQTVISLPYVQKETPDYMLTEHAENMFEQDGKLYLVTYEYGSFCLNEETQKVEPVPADTTYSINRSEDGKQILVTKGNLSWTIDAQDCMGNVIGFEDDVLYFWLCNPNLIPGGMEDIDPDYERCHILKCVAGKDGTVESFVYDYQQGWGLFPWCFARVARDGYVYVLVLYDEMFAVYKLKVGYEDIVNP